MRNPSRWSWHDLLAVLLVIMAASLAWSKRIGGGDTFVSLAAGRDALAGKMGLPDEWSFTTEGRIWLDQNWGSHTTYYVSYWLLGDTGPVAVKWLVIFGTMLLMIRAATARGADRRFAAVIVAVTILVARSFLDVRPHIFTLLFEAALIVVLFQWYKGSSVWAFVATAIIGLWANMHGGFIFGLGVMGLWLGAQGLMKLVWSRSRPWGWSHLMVLATALGVAVLLAAFANPFGPINLTHPLVVEKSDIWLSVQEWKPILDWKAMARDLTFKQAPGFGSVTEFLILMGVFAATVIGWTLARTIRMPDEGGSPAKAERPGRRRDGRRRGHPRRPRRDIGPAGSHRALRTGLFDLGLTVVVIAMAFKARRFVPLATVAVVPIMVALLEDMMGRIKRVVAGRPLRLWSPQWRQGLIGANVALLAAGGVLARPHIYLPYHDPNPAYPKQTVLMRMVGSQTFPEAAIDFLLAQDDLPPETFVDWRWEGYVRWRTDRLKTFCGGRAQQVHSERIAKWQITAPSRGGKILHVRPFRGGAAIDNSQIAAVVDGKKRSIAEIGAGRLPLARLDAAIAVTSDGQTTKHEADRVVSWRFTERTEYWADIEVVVERTSEPKFRAEYVLTILGDQPWSQGSGFCEVRLKRLANTGSSPYQVVSHGVLMTPLRPGIGRPISQGPIGFWQAKDLRYGLAAVRTGGGMTPRVDASGKSARLASVGLVAKTLDPNEAYVPEQATCLAFVHRAKGNLPPRGTLSLLHYVAHRNCRRLVDAADEHGIKIFILPRKAVMNLGRLLMGSKRWACVFNDRSAFVLLNRKDPRNQRIIENILAGKAEYPDEYLRALGKALTRHCLAPPGAKIEEFQQDLKNALKVKPDASAYWWLMESQSHYSRAVNTEVLGKDLTFWLEQWELLSARPIDPQEAAWAYLARQIVAQAACRTSHRLGRKAEAEQWHDRFKAMERKIGQLRRKYF